MANETISFVLVTALFGMAVVALFLTLLSLVMHLIRTTDEAFARRAGGGEVATGAGEPSGTPTPPLPFWAIAAAAVYLDAEDEAASHSATPWTARLGR